MEIIQAIILGIVEGFTEFLPISSTGHIVVAADLIGYKDTAEIFTVVIQVGAILAVIWHYRKNLIDKFAGFFARDPQAVKFMRNWVIATAPAVLAGYLLRDYLTVVAVAAVVATSFIVGGVAMWLIETFHKPPKPPKTGDKVNDLTLKQSVLVGLYQTVALIPGVSRSGATIMGGLLTGMDRVTATAFSFYLSIPIIILAGGYQLFNGRDNLDSISGGAPALIVGTIVSFVAALITIKWLLAFVSRYSFKIFAYYRIIVGGIVLLVIM